MQKLILLFALTIFFNAIKAQNFNDEYFEIAHNLYLNGKKVNSAFGGGVYTLFWDTCIQNKKYKFLSVSVELPLNCDRVYKKWLLRIEPQRIFIFYPSLGQEKLLYDMSKTVGDTIRISPPRIIRLPDIVCTRFDTIPSYEQMRIVIKDTLISYGGVMRKTLFFNDTFCVWAAGIGALNGSFLDPYGEARFDSSYVGKMLWFDTKDTSCVAITFAALTYIVTSYKYNATSSHFPPFYISQNCADPLHPDTIQLDTSLCYRPANYQNIEVRLDKWKYQCGDTLHAHLQTGYLPPNFSYQWIPDSTMIVRPINGKAPSINLKTFGSNPLCNKDWKITPNTNCAYCKDTTFSPRIKSTSSFDNFFCPNPIVRTYTAIGNDTSLHWYYLKPLPITYTNQVYYVKNVIYNQYCRDTITTDTLFLHCNIPCAFPQKACAHIVCNKQEVYKGDVIQYTAVCDSHCTGFSYEWDNGLSTESLPVSYPDTTYTKKLYCWNSYGLRDTLIHTIKVKWGSGIEQFSTPVSYGIENNLLNIYTEKTVNSIELYDMLGNRCMNAENTKQIDLSKFAKGIFIMHIKIDGEMIIQKMVR